jgi:hypothetical protein
MTEHLARLVEDQPGRHAGPPIGSEAREATTPPYRGTHRAEQEAHCSYCGQPPHRDLPDHPYRDSVKEAEHDRQLSALFGGMPAIKPETWHTGWAAWCDGCGRQAVWCDCPPDYQHPDGDDDGAQ